MRVSIRFFAKFGEIFGREHLVDVPEGSRIIDAIRMITNEKREIIDDMLISLVEMFEDHVLEDDIVGDSPERKREVLWRTIG